MSASAPSGNRSVAPSSSSPRSAAPHVSSAAAAGMIARSVSKSRVVAATSATVRSRKTKHRKINTQHPEFELTYDMMLGIRTVVSKTEAQPHSALTDGDYTDTVKLHFPGRGGILTPAHIMRDFKFKDYSPVVYKKIREAFGINPADYLLCVCGNFQYLEFVSNSKSGQFFFYTHDRQFMIKTVSKQECKFLQHILPSYFEHISSNPNTLLTKFFGMHRVKPHKKLQRHFLIMSSVFHTDKFIHTVFDLKGSTQGRAATAKEIASGNPVYKDNDFTGMKVQLRLSPLKAQQVQQQIARDTDFLRRLRIMDYCVPQQDHELLTDRGFMGYTHVRDALSRQQQAEADAARQGRPLDELRALRLCVACPVYVAPGEYGLHYQPITTEHLTPHDLTSSDLIQFRCRPSRCKTRTNPGEAETDDCDGPSNGDVDCGAADVDDAYRAVNLVVTGAHRMLVRTGASPDSKPWPRTANVTARDIHESSEQHVQLLCLAAHGVADSRPDQPLPFADALQLKSHDESEAFVELFGYWLGDGSLDGEDKRVTLQPRKDADVAFLDALFTRLSALPLRTQAELACDLRLRGYEKRIDDSGLATYRIHDDDWWSYFAEQYGHLYWGQAALDAVIAGAARRGSGLPAARYGRLFYDRTRNERGSETPSLAELQSAQAAGAHRSPRSEPRPDRRPSSPEPAPANDVDSGKWMPWWVWQRCDARLLRLLLRGLRVASGNQSDEREQRAQLEAQLHTANRTAAAARLARCDTQLLPLAPAELHTASALCSDQYQHVALRAGFSCIVSRAAALWGVSYYHDGAVAKPKLVLRGLSGSTSRPEVRQLRSLEPVPVWCVRVPTADHLIIVRRIVQRQADGCTVGDSSRPCIVGNSLLLGIHYKERPVPGGGAAASGAVSAQQGESEVTRSRGVDREERKDAQLHRQPSDAADGVGVGGARSAGSTVPSSAARAEGAKSDGERDGSADDWSSKTFASALHRTPQRSDSDVGADASPVAEVTWHGEPDDSPAVADSDDGAAPKADNDGDANDGRTQKRSAQPRQLRLKDVHLHIHSDEHAGAASDELPAVGAGARLAPAAESASPSSIHPAAIEPVDAALSSSSRPAQPSPQRGSGASLPQLLAVPTTPVGVAHSAAAASSSPPELHKRQSTYGLPKRWNKTTKPSDIAFEAPEFEPLPVTPALDSPRRKSDRHSTATATPAAAAAVGRGAAASSSSSSPAGCAAAVLSHAEATYEEKDGGRLLDYFGGIGSTDVVDGVAVAGCGREVYFMGIIDILTVYNVGKFIENRYKRARLQRGISAVSPRKYAERFKAFVAAAITVVQPTPTPPALNGQLQPQAAAQQQQQQQEQQPAMNGVIK